MRRLGRVLALVLTVAFAFGTFHVHAHAGALPDTALVVATTLDDAGHGADRSPDTPDRHVAVDCPVCALLTHVLGPAATLTCQPQATCRERFVLGNETSRSPPLFELHRPPIAHAV